MSSTLRKKLGLGQAPQTETRRISNLPRVDEHAAGDLTEEFRVPGSSRVWTTKDGVQVKGLRPIQSEMLAAIKAYKGLVGAVGVGHGKALVALLAPTVLGAKLGIIFTRARLVTQLRQTYHEWRRHYQMLPPAQLKIVAYSELSQPKSSALLEAIVGEYEDHEVVMVADEVHMLKRLESARTKRLLRFFNGSEERKGHPGVPFIALSGTLAGRKMEQATHICELALKELSPFPRDSGVGSHAEAWSQCIDADGKPGPHHWKTVGPLVEAWGDHSTFTSSRGKSRVQAVREAFQNRFRSAPGVVVTTDSSVPCALNIYKVVCPVPPEVSEKIQKARDAGEDPGGEVLPDAISLWNLERCLSSGFYYKWDWPYGCRACRETRFRVLASTGCSKSFSKKHILGVMTDEEWLLARREWGILVRKELKEFFRENYDSEFLVSTEVQRRIARKDPPTSLTAAWGKWSEQKVKRWKGQPRPPTITIPVSTFLMDDLERLVKKIDRKCLVWYSSQGFAEMLRDRGWTVYGGGQEPAPGLHTCAVSTNAHRDGLDLQRWAVNIVVEPPSSGEAWEQMLGRTHRPGQRSDEVEVHVYQHTDSFRKAVLKAREEANFAEDGLGNRQKLNLATWVGF